MKTSRYLESIVIGALVMGGCVVPQHEFEIRRAWPAGSIHQLEVEGINGKIEVTATTSNQITMTAKGTTSGPGKDDEIVRADVADGTLRIHEGGRRSYSVFSIRHGRHIDYTIQVPATLTGVNLTNVNGRISVAGISGKLMTHSVNGEIHVSTPRGELTAATVNGAVNAEFLEQFTGAHLRTVNGAIAVSVPANSSIDSNVSQVNGNFRSDIPLVTTSSRGSTSGSAEGGQFPFEATTVNGSVTLSKNRT